MENNRNESLRQKAIADSSQIIVKAGSRLVIGQEAVAKLIDGIASLRQAGHRVLLVTSGAVGLGMALLGIERRPRQLARKQALAAIGQSRLMSLYTQEAARHGFQVAQLLLTAADLRNRERYLNVMNCINALWEKDVLPIVNENDSVSVDELKFGDNDTLAGMLASVTGAGLTILLTTVDGLCGRNPDGSLGARLPVVDRLTPDIRALAGGTDNSEMSVGGMASKLRAAELATAGGGWLWIADGRKPGITESILKGEDTGTLFLPKVHKMPGRKRWFGFFSRVTGILQVDAGAKSALLNKGGSLLSPGIAAVSGEFKRGDTVEIVGGDGLPFARGLVNFDAAFCRRMLGKHAEELQELLGEGAEPEVIHRDNLILLEQ